MIRAHHQRAIDRLANAYRDDPAFLGLIIGGSIAKGFARDDSDVDFMMVATDEEFQRRCQTTNFINRTDLCDYEGGYVDGKIIDVTYLEDVCIRGTNPTRSAFEGVFMPFHTPPNSRNWSKEFRSTRKRDASIRVRSFYCMAFIQQWLMNEATRHNNAYTIMRAASQLSLFCGRLILGTTVDCSRITSGCRAPWSLLTTSRRTS